MLPLLNQSGHFLFHVRYDGVAYITTTKARTGDISGKAQSESAGPSSHKINYE